MLCSFVYVTPPDPLNQVTSNRPALVTGNSICECRSGPHNWIYYGIYIAAYIRPALDCGSWSMQYCPRYPVSCVLWPVSFVRCPCVMKTKAFADVVVVVLVGFMVITQFELIFGCHGNLKLVSNHLHKHKLKLCGSFGIWCDFDWIAKQKGILLLALKKKLLINFLTF